MPQQAEKMTIAIKPEQRQALREMAHQEGQDVELFIAQILQEAIDQKHAVATSAKIARIRQNFARIRRHRNALLAKRKNTPLHIDTVALLHTLREEHDEYLLTHIPPRKPRLVIDANVAVWAVVPVVSEIQTLDLLQHWH